MRPPLKRLVLRLVNPSPQLLDTDDIANAVIYALTAPPHVAINTGELGYCVFTVVSCIVTPCKWYLVSYLLLT
jgi:hypothetical protein